MSRIIKEAIPGVIVNENNQIVFENNVVIQGGMVFGPAITETITGNIDNLNIVNLSGGVLVRLTSTGNFNITGLVNPDITQGLWVIINNIGNNSITLMDNNASSAPNNRFLLGASKNLQANEGLTLVYDTISLRWRPFGINI